MLGCLTATQFVCKDISWQKATEMKPKVRVCHTVLQLFQVFSSTYRMIGSNTPFSITTRHTVPTAELLSWDSGYTLFNYKTPHSDQS